MLPPGLLTPDLVIEPTGDDDYVAIVGVHAGGPRDARGIGADAVEQVLRLLAVQNGAFVVRLDQVSAVIDPPDQERSATFVEDYVDVEKRKESLDAETKWLDGLASAPEYLLDALELNYMLVTSSRLKARLLLAVIGLDALASGSLGAPPTVFQRLGRQKAKEVSARLEISLQESGLDPEEQSRLLPRLQDAFAEPVAAHIQRYLESTGQSVDVEDLKRWWQLRGRLAHAGSSDLELGDVNRLITILQTALRFEVDRLVE